MGVSVTTDVHATEDDGLDYLQELILHSPSSELIIEFYNVMDSCLGGGDQEVARRLSNVVSKLADILDDAIRGTIDSKDAQYMFASAVSLINHSMEDM